MLWVALMSCECIKICTLQIFDFWYFLFFFFFMKYCTVYFPVLRLPSSWEVLYILTTRSTNQLSG